MQITEIAEFLAEKASREKRPYAHAKWFAEFGTRIYWTRDEGIQGYFAAINLMRSRGIENQKRAPRTGLSKEQRQRFRAQAKALAKVVAQVAGCECKLTRKPVQEHSPGVFVVQLGVQYKPGQTCFFYPNLSEVECWAAADELAQYSMVWRWLESRKGTNAN